MQPRFFHYPHDLALQFVNAAAAFIAAAIVLVVWHEVTPVWRSPSRHLLLPVAGVFSLAALFFTIH